VGFHTIIATLMLTIILISFAYFLIAESTAFTEIAIESYRGCIDTELKRLRTEIEIVNVSYDPSQNILTAYFKNTGSEKFADFENFDAFIYGRTDSGEEVSIYLQPNYTITREFINPNIFDPQEIAKLSSQISLEGGSYVLQLTTPNAVISTFDFTV